MKEVRLRGYTVYGAINVLLFVEKANLHGSVVSRDLGEGRGRLQSDRGEV